jgi:thioredoxin-like negative regulator of GroEL
VSLLGARRRLKALAESEDETELVKAAQALSETPGRHVRRGLEQLLSSHVSPHVRAKAAWALGFHASGKEAAPSLMRVLGDPNEDTDVRCHAAEALGHLAPEEHSEVLAGLLHALADRSPEVRFWSAFALGNLGDERAIPALRRVADSDTESVEGWWSIRKEALDSIDQIELLTRNARGPRGVEKA